MKEVSALTGVPPSTVRYYTKTGLVPPPARLAARRHRYDERHVEALRLVKLLKERRSLSADSIRAILPELLERSADGAFRPAMWDELVEASVRTSASTSPAARLLSAGVDAFTKRGYAEVRVDDVCRAAKVAKGSFYRHFSSKEELYFAVVQEVARRAGERFEVLAGRAAGPSGLLDAEAAHEVLVKALQPQLALMLDLMALAAQRRPGHGPALRELFTSLYDAVCPRLCPDDLGRAEEILARSRVSGLRHIVVSPMLERQLYSLRQAL